MESFRGYSSESFEKGLRSPHPALNPPPDCASRLMASLAFLSSLLARVYVVDRKPPSQCAHLELSSLRVVTMKDNQLVSTNIIKGMINLWELSKIKSPCINWCKICYNPVPERQVFIVRLISSMRRKNAKNKTL